MHPLISCRNIALFVGVSLAAATAWAETETVRTLMWDPGAAQELRERSLSGDAEVSPAVEDLRKRADEALAAGPFSVTHKKFLPPSGDLRDFSTIGRYWWPNPDTEDGLPWVRRDGETNPQYFDSDFGDTQRLVDLWRSVVALSRAYHVTDHEPYAEKAGELLRVWFIDGETRMNPHAKYAARFPGHWDGKSWGIHGTRHLADIAEAAMLLQRSAAWTESDHAALQQWYREYLDWLLTSENGIEEANTINNHSTAYDWIIVMLAGFVGDDDLAKQTLEAVKARRIAAQIEPDGTQPAELKRATPWRYAGYNLEFLFKLAILGDRYGVDLWAYETEDGRSMKKALDLVVQQLAPEPGRLDDQMVKDVGVTRIGPLLAIAAEVYDEPRYRELMQQIGWDDSLDLAMTGPNPNLYESH